MSTANAESEQRTIERQRAAVLAGAAWWTAQQVVDRWPMLFLDQPVRWAATGRLLALTVDGSARYPSYAFTDAGDPQPALAPILRVLSPHWDLWGVAGWFTSVNASLGGHRPQDLLAFAPSRVLAAAHEALEPIAHG